MTFYPDPNNKSSKWRDILVPELNNTETWRDLLFEFERLQYPIFTVDTVYVTQLTEVRPLNVYGLPS